MFQEKPKETGWRWRYNVLLGIMYGPIPVGWIVVIAAFAGYMIYTALTS